MHLAMYVNDQLFKKVPVRHIGWNTATAKQEYYNQLAVEIRKRHQHQLNPTDVGTFFVEGVPSKMNQKNNQRRKAA